MSPAADDLARYEVVLAPQALSHLRNIKRYVSGELFSPQSAERLVGRLLDAAESLSTLPLRHRVLATDSATGLDIRCLTCEKYALLYTAKGETVFIFACLHGSSNIEARLVGLMDSLPSP